MERRNFLIGAAASGSCLILPPTAAQAGFLNPLSLGIGRFLAGLVLGTVRAVFITLASDYIVGKIRGGSYSGGSFVSSAYAATLEQSIPQSGYNAFYAPDNYKASLILLNEVDFQIQKKVEIDIFLKHSEVEQIGRLEALRKYLVDKKTEATFLTEPGEASRIIVSADGLSNLLAIKRLATSPKEREYIMRELIDITQSNLFKMTS